MTLTAGPMAVEIALAGRPASAPGTMAQGPMNGPAPSDPYARMLDVVQVGSEMALVARTAEMSRLHDAWDRARTGVAGAVLLCGDAGVGKTRLIAEFAEHVRADDGLVLIGHCVGLGQSAPPYLPLVEILEQIRDVDPALVSASAPLASLVSAGPALGADRTSEQLQLFDSVLGALTALSVTRPVLLVIEDLHWSDPSTRDLITFLIARMGEQSLAAVLTYRTDDIHRQHPVRPMLIELTRMRRVDRLELDAFTPEDARAFARALADLTGAGVDERRIVDVAKRSEGNAFFVEELMATSATSGTAITGALVDVLLGRIERLSEPAQRVVRAASVSGQRRVRHDTLVAVIGRDEDEVELALRECVQFHVLVASDDAAGSYEFRHALLREAVYADLLPGERSRLHGAYARLLADLRLPGWRGAQAYHATKSNDLRTALAAYVAAAADALEVAAPADSLSYLESALALWDAVPDAAEVAGADELTLLIRASDAAVAAGQVERAISFTASAMELADAGTDVVVRAAVRRRLAKILFAEDRWEEADRVITEAYDLIADQAASSERAWVLSVYALFGSSRRRYVEQAIEDARAVGDGGAEADALISLAYVVMRAGQVEEAMDLLQTARRRAAEVGADDVELRAWFNLAIGRFEQGHFDEAVEHLDAGLARANETGLIWATYGRELRWVAVLIHYAHGTWDAVERLASPPGEQAPDWISGVLAASAAQLHASRGEWAEVDAALARVEPWVLESEEPRKIASFAKAERDLWQQRPGDVARMVADTLHAAEGDDPPELSLIRVAALGVTAQADLAVRARQLHDPRAEQAAIAQGHRFLEAAENAAAHGIPRADTLGPEGLAWLVRARAEASRMRAERDPAIWQSLVEATSYGDVYLQALARWRLAEVLLTSDASDDGEGELTDALTVARRLRARPLEEALLNLARRHRLSVPGARPASVDLLTPRERSVLELVAQGLTNRAVGDELFISEKTVSVHLTRVMGKLGASSRTEAVALAMQRGVLGAP